MLIFIPPLLESCCIHGRSPMCLVIHRPFFCIVLSAIDTAFARMIYYVPHVQLPTTIMGDQFVPRVADHFFVENEYLRYLNDISTAADTKNQLSQHRWTFKNTNDECFHEDLVFSYKIKGLMIDQRSHNRSTFLVHCRMSHERSINHLTANPSFVCNKCRTRRLFVCFSRKSGGGVFGSPLQWPPPQMPPGNQSKRSMQV